MKVEQWLKARLPKSKKELWKLLKEQLVGLGKALLFYGVIFGILYSCQALLQQMYFLNPWMKGEIAIDMLKAIINVDGALIGFIGIIAVYGLREVSRTIERAQQVLQAWQKHKDRLESWQTNFLYLLSMTVLALAASILYSLQSISYATLCGAVDNQLKCLVLDAVSSSYFVLPLDGMFLGMAGIVWIIRSLRTPIQRDSRSSTSVVSASILCVRGMEDIAKTQSNITNNPPTAALQ